jgi:hypothetical protein
MVYLPLVEGGVHPGWIVCASMQQLHAHIWMSATTSTMETPCTYACAHAMTHAPQCCALAPG